MKSLVAWSSDQVLDRTKHAERALAGQSMMAEVSGEIDAIVGKLIETASLYEAIQAHQLQKKAIRSWVTDQGSLLKSTMAEQAEKLRENLSNAVASTIVPLLSDVIEKKAVDDFCGMVEEVIQKALQKNLVISVPGRLHETLQSEMRRRGLDVRMETSSNDEMILQAEDLRVETSLTEFNEKLQRAVAA